MKNILLILAILLTSATVFAINDWTILGGLKPHETIVRGVNIPEGKTVIEVWTGDNSKISCQFLDVNGNIGLEEDHVNRCVGRANIVLPWHLNVKITNDENQETDFKIWIHPDK